MHRMHNEFACKIKLLTTKRSLGEQMLTLAFLTRIAPPSVVEIVNRDTVDFRLIIR